MQDILRFTLGLLIVAPALAAGCGSNNDSSSGGGGAGGHAGTGGVPEQTGSSCSSTAQCYPSLDAGALKGEVACLTQVTNGYCTHKCQTDADCCAVPGECKTNIPEVCASFESSGQTYCFLSCEDSVVAAANVSYDGGIISDSTLYCQVEASSAFTCRSTGGGVKQRKVCLP